MRSSGTSCAHRHVDLLLYRLAQFAALAEIRQTLDGEVILARRLRRVRQPADTQQQIVLQRSLDVGEELATDEIQVFDVFGVAEQLRVRLFFVGGFRRGSMVLRAAR